MARRYHWHSASLNSFVEEPHTAVCGNNQGEILNLTAADAASSRNGMLLLSNESPEKIIREFQHLVMPTHHDVRSEDVNLKKLGATLWLAHDSQLQNFEELLLLQGVGPRTIQSLALVSEVIHGSPSRFKDPARFSFAHGGKDGHPFPVPVKVYDEVIDILHSSIRKSKLGVTDKNEAIKRLHQVAVRAEKNFVPNSNFDALIEKERQESWKYDGRTVYGKAAPPRSKRGVQLRLF
jgi:hypothetical protein